MRFLLILYLVFFLSCSGKQKPISTPEVVINHSNEVYNSDFQSIIDSFDVVGSILVYDLQNDIYYSNDFEWAKRGNLPASTFKIPNSIIGIETGIIESDSTIFRWNGEDRWSPTWEKDLTLNEAFHLSCVPCYQELARGIGVQRMNDYIQKIDYGQIVVDHNTIDNFWLFGDSRISQFQQISFLRRLFLSKLPITERTEKIIRKLLVIDQNDEYTLSGKTGLSNENNHYNGWFVGFLETKKNTFFYATNIEPKEGKQYQGFNNKRKDITMMALQEMVPIAFFN
ncbi:MAG: beta-lactamase class D [Saprospiraceae bacterium]|jgi:beta-lactamase class D|tara:strand:+ start:2032 stop:2880 length:849 start_codon:yes stop_codon:yes gene_type:complete